MPLGSVALSAPTLVMPLSLSLHYTQSREYQVLQNTYKTGDYQRSLITFVSQRTYTQTRRMSWTDMNALVSFYESVNGGQKAFYFYDGWETIPLFHYDASGVTTTGRVIVVFVGALSVTGHSGSLGDVDLKLLEVV